MNDESDQSLDDLTGPEVIRDFVKRLPGKPGVYRMFNAEGDAIYVGKARNLKNRVSNYARGQGHNNRIALMISLTTNMEFVTTATEAEALLLEANLIKKLKPRFNVILRDDKSFPYILIAKDHEVAQLVKHRGARARKGSYYGPFASAGAVNQSLNTLQKAFLLRSCNDSVYANRTRPCLLYQIKRCSAPCVNYIELPAYNELVREAESFLDGKSQTVKAELATAMEAASEALDFEQAARLRDRIQAMSFCHPDPGHQPARRWMRRMFSASPRRAGRPASRCSSSARGRTGATRAYFPRADKSMEAPKFSAPSSASSMMTSRFPSWFCCPTTSRNWTCWTRRFPPMRAARLRCWCPSGAKSARLSSMRSPTRGKLPAARWPRSSSQAKLLAGVAEVFGLAEPPRRIEVYDNSHIPGHQSGRRHGRGRARGLHEIAVPQIQYPLGRPDGGDDFGMMREMLTRRFSRLLKEEGRARARLRDGPPGLILLLIDGGQGQLSAVRGVLADLGLDDMPVVGVAKGPDRDAGREHFFVPGKPSFMLAAATRCSTISSGCGMRRTVLPLAATGRGAHRPLA